LRPLKKIQRKFLLGFVRFIKILIKVAWLSFWILSLILMKLSLKKNEYLMRLNYKV